ncbi:MFS transporter [Paraburkholderia sediminicola]|uniref:MFS transporter n=1 Tax=Paraburkholderia sediminicola TaxID=458836 RepID=UPI0038B7EC05
MNQRASGGSSSYENRLLCLLSLTFGIVVFDRSAMQLLAPFVMQDLSLNNTQIGALAAALSVTWALSGYLLSRLCDRRGRYRFVLISSIVAFSLCSFLSGLASTFTALLLIRMLMGSAEGAILPISQTLMAGASSEGRRGFNMGVMQTLGANLVGAFLAPVLLVLAATHWGWRHTFFVAGLPGLVCAGIAWRIVRDPPKSVAVESPTGGLRDLREILRHRNIIICMLLSGLVIGYFMLAIVYLPLYITGPLHMSPQTMGVMMSILGLSAVISGLIVPGLSDRFGRKRVLVLPAILSLLAPLGIVFYGETPAVLGLILFFGFTGSGLAPLVMATLPAETMAGHRVAAAIGLSMGAGEILGGVMVPLLGGAIADRWGLAAPLYLQSAFMLTAILLLAMLRETGQAKRASIEASSASA